MFVAVGRECANRDVLIYKYDNVTSTTTSPQMSLRRWTLRKAMERRYGPQHYIVPGMVLSLPASALV